jgi:signal transduction histidine kinase
MNRPRLILGILVSCLIVVLAAMAWVSIVVVDLDRRDALAQRQAELDESSRLALWRMDSALGPLIAQEDTRPYYEYRSFHSPTMVFDTSHRPVPGETFVVASPLLVQPPPFIKLHFQIDPEGEISSPQVPESVIPETVERQLDATGLPAVALETLRSLTQQLDRDALLEAAPDPDSESRVRSSVLGSPRTNLTRQMDPNSQQFLEEMYGGPNLQQTAPVQEKQMGRARNARSQQELRSNIEYQQRVDMNAQGALINKLNRYANNSAQGAADWLNQAASLPAKISTSLSPAVIREGAMSPLWMNGDLVLIRQIQIDEETWLQGCLLDWKTLQSWLQQRIADLLPNAQLFAVKSSSAALEDTAPHLLAMLPVRLAPGTLDANRESLSGPIRTSLFFAWLCTLLAMVAVIAVVIGMATLSERRAAFVSAVTHELRTPLTTFRMYTEMLTDGMVTDETRRRQYLDTLRVESDRLARLVENVLSYARLERRRTELQTENVSVGTMLDRFTDRLVQRAQQADMQVSLELDDAARDITVKTDVSAVEQIVFNLVDNACKYASTAEDRRIHIGLSADRKRISLSVSDHGPGLDADAVRRLFLPFSKSAQAAAKTAHGVGLGLALSLRLARRLKGNLKWSRKQSDGCRFDLVLPRS